MKPFTLTFCVFLMASLLTAQIPRPQIGVGGNLGPGGPFPLFNHGTLIMATDANYTMGGFDTTATLIRVTSSVPLTATRNIVAPTTFGFLFTFQNATTGGQAIQVIGSSGTGVTIPNGQASIVMFDGTNYVSIGSGGGPGGGPLVSPVIIHSPANINTLTINVPDSGDPNLVSSTGIIDINHLFVTDLAGTGVSCLQTDALGNISRFGSACGSGGPGGGTVTSIGLSGNPFFNITNTPVTTAGTINIDYNPQVSTYVLAGPSLATNPNPPRILQSKICVGLTGPPWSCTFNAPTQAGSLIFFGPTRYNPVGSAPTCTGNTTDNLGQVYSFDPSCPLQAAFYKENSAAGVTTVTTTVSTGSQIVMLEIANVATSNSLDGSSYQIGNIGINQPITWENFSTRNAADIVVGYWICAVPSSTTPTMAPLWPLGGYQSSPTGGSAGWIYRNVNTVGTYLPAVATADCLQGQQQQAYAMAFKVNLLASTAIPTFRPMVPSDLPATPYSGLTDPAQFYLTQLDMNTGASIWYWNIYATNTANDYGFGLLMEDESKANPTCYIYPPEVEPSCRVMLDVASNWPNIWPLEADSCATGNAGACGGFHVAGDTGNIVLQANSTVSFPNSIVGAGILATDANGNLIGLPSSYDSTNQILRFTGTGGAIYAGTLVSDTNMVAPAFTINPTPPTRAADLGSRSGISTHSSKMRVISSNATDFLDIDVPTTGGPTLTSSTGVITISNLMLPNLKNVPSLGTDANGNLISGSGSSGTMVYPAAGIPSSTGTAWGSSYTTANPIPLNLITGGGTPAPCTITPITSSGAYNVSTAQFSPCTQFTVGGALVPVVQLPSTMPTSGLYIFVTSTSTNTFQVAAASGQTINGVAQANYIPASANNYSYTMKVISDSTRNNWIVQRGPTAFGQLVSGTAINDNFLMGAGSSLSYSGTGTVNANQLLGSTLPALVSGYLQYNGTSFSWATPPSVPYPPAGVPNSSGTSWSTSYSASNPFPVTFIPSPLSQNTTGNAATASALQTQPSLCPTGQFAQGIAASGNAAGCAVPTTITSLPFTNITTGTVTGQTLSVGANSILQPGPSAGGIVANELGNAQGALGGSGTVYQMPSTFTNGFLQFNGTALVWGAPTASSVPFPGVTTGTSTGQTLTLGNGSRITYTTGGIVDASWLNHLQVPALTTGYLQYNGTAFVWSTPATGGAGTGTCTVNQYVNAVNSGAPTCSQVTYAQLSGTVPTWNQNTSGTAANITGTTNSTLTTLSALSLPYSQLTSASVSNQTFIIGSSSLLEPNSGGLIYANGLASSSGVSGGNYNMPATFAAGYLQYVPGTGLQWGTPSTSTATNLAGGVLGSVPYQSAPATTTFLAPNTTTTATVLQQTGTGSAGAGPIWTSAPAISANNFTSFPSTVCTTTTCNVTNSGSSASSARITTNGTTGQYWGMTSGTVQGWVTPSAASSLQWSSLTNPTVGLTLNMGSNTTDFHFIPTGSGAVGLTLDDVGSTVTGSTILGVSATHVGTQPFYVHTQNSGGITVDTNGNLLINSLSNLQLGGIKSAATLGTDGSGNVIVGTGGAPSISSLTNATTTASISNGNNSLSWQWLLTSTLNGLTFSESGTGATGTGSLLAVQTSGSSPVSPFYAYANGGSNGLKVDSTGNVNAVGTAKFVGPVQLPSALANVSRLGTDSNGNIIANPTAVYTASHIGVPLQTATGLVPITGGSIGGTITGGSCTTTVCTMATPPADGTYQLNLYIGISTNGGTCSAGAITLQIGYTDADTGVAVSATTMAAVPMRPLNGVSGSGAMTMTSQSVSQTFNTMPQFIRARNSIPITYQINQSTGMTCTGAMPIISIRAALIGPLGY